MYRWAKTNTPSAGTIASAVNAMMPASFCEYCVWNVYVPRGRVKADVDVDADVAGAGAGATSYYHDHG
jgi:hypothetical protein